MRRRLFLVLALGVLGCATAAAQQIQPVTYVGDFHVKPGKEEDFLNLVKKIDEPIFDKLMKDGAVLGWGVDVPVQHSEGSPNFSLWWSCPDMAGMDKVFAAFEEAEKKWKEEDDKAAAEAKRKGQPAPKTAYERFLDTIDISKHRDWTDTKTGAIRGKVGDENPQLIPLRAGVLNASPRTQPPT